MKELLAEFVSISSETKDLEGVFQVQKKLHALLHALGAELRWLDPEVEGYAPGLLAKWPASARNTKLEPGVCLVAHADTVYPKELLKESSFNEESGMLLGSGVADNKGGLVIAYAALKKLFDEGKLKNTKRPLYLFCSSCEELGSPAFQTFIKEFSLNLDFVLGMEPALPDGALIKKRRGNRYYRIEVFGNSVHTGRDLKEAANPMRGVALLVDLIEDLKEKHPKISASLNGIKGYPFKFNMSSEKIEMNLDTRFDLSEDIHAFHEELSREIASLSFKSPDKKHSGRFSVEIVDDCPAFDSGMPGAELLEVANSFSKVEGKKVSFGDGLGSSDCCYFYREGLKILDGLGPRGGKIHSPEEFIEPESLENRASALAMSLLEL
ncbi:MAG: M20/M25/M40 family metallo-hydrolase [Bdellovibrionota bacterium]